MRYSVSGRAPSIISAALALLLAIGMHLAAGQADADPRGRMTQVASAAAQDQPSGVI
jgi:hypothetical protein